jgi:CheY-like chemotaxis protein
MLTILAVGEDSQLLRSRAGVLRRSGANVVCSTGAAALKLIADWEFNLIVLCHSVTTSDAAQITTAAHSTGSKTLVLLLVAEAVREQSYEGIHFDDRSFIEPDCLIRSATELLNRHTKHGPPQKPSAVKVTLPSFTKPASVPAEIATRKAIVAQFWRKRRNQSDDKDCLHEE